MENEQPKSSGKDQLVVKTQAIQEAVKKLNIEIQSSLSDFLEEVEKIDDLVNQTPLP